MNIYCTKYTIFSMNDADKYHCFKIHIVKLLKKGGYKTCSF